MARPSLHAATTLYLNALYEAGVPDGTRKAYGSVLTRLCRKYPTRQFAGIDTKALAGFLYGPGGIALGKAPSTTTLQRAAIRSFLRYGHTVGWRKDMPAIPEPVIRSGRTRGRVAPPTRLTADELVLMLDRASSPLLRGMLAVGINTALRVSDIRKIRIGDLGFATGEVSVVIQKTGLVDALPITSDLDTELRRYLTWYTAEVGVSLHDADAPLFPGFTTDYDKQLTADRMISYGWANHRLHELYLACGIIIDKAECWHTIRRSVARIYFDSLRNDISFDHALRQTAALLGHKNVSQTETYLGLDAEIQARNDSLRGKRLIVASGNVVQLPRRAG